MAPIHNSHHHHATSPRQATIHSQVTITIHNRDRGTSVHSERAPIPMNTAKPRSSHSLLSTPNVHWYCKDESLVPDRVAIHNHIRDIRSNDHKDRVHRKRSGTKHVRPPIPGQRL